MIAITNPREAYKNYIIYHIESGIELDHENSQYTEMLTEVERRNIIWHVLSLYMPDSEIPRHEDTTPVYEVYEKSAPAPPEPPRRKCSCGKK